MINSPWHQVLLIPFKIFSVGHTANYAVVVAQLYTHGVCHGIHPFIVQLRDEDTHMPLPGIKIGEIGAKMGMNGTNNGYLGFDNVRIPRDHMLMKNAQVLEVCESSTMWNAIRFIISISEWNVCESSEFQINIRNNDVRESSDRQRYG